MGIDIMHVAKLAHLEIPDDKLADFQSDMESIVKMVEQLPDIDDELAPDESNSMELRADKTEESVYTKDELLRNAPEIRNGCFLVPKTV